MPALDALLARLKGQQALHLALWRQPVHQPSDPQAHLPLPFQEVALPDLTLDQLLPRIIVFFT